MNNATGRIVSVLIVVFLLFYAGYQAYRYVYQPYRTEITYQDSVADTVYSQGIVVRQEEALASSGSGVVSYTAKEAEKVSVGYPLAYYYSDAQQAKNVAAAKQLQEEISLLQRVQAPGSRVFTNNETLSGHIDELVGEVVELVASGSGDRTAQLKESLLQDICKKQLSVGEIDNFDARIDELSAHQRNLEASLPTSVPQLSAPKQGYFSRYVDHHESVFTPQSLETMTADDIRQAVEQKYSYDPALPGKLVLTHTWYYAAALDLEDAEKFHLGDTVYVTFGSQQLKDIPMIVDQVKKEDGQAVVILSSDTIVPGVLAMRAAVGEINFKTYSGLRVNETAIRMVDGVVGVYVVSGYDLKFKAVDILYDGPGYKLCAINYTNSSNLKLFDEVVVEGTDLYDGKPLL